MKEMFEELKEIIEFRSKLRELEMWLDSFINNHNKGNMTIQEFHDEIQKIVEKEEGYLK